MCLVGDEGTKWCETLADERVELERERIPVEVVFIAYGCGFDLRFSFVGEERDVEEDAGEG